MRLTDLEKLIKPKLGTRVVQIETKDLVQQMKMNSSFAMEKIKELPQAVRDELKPFFSTKFFKERTV